MFAAHDHAFLFVAGSLIAVLPMGFITGALALWMLVYLAWSTRAVYGGRWSGMVARAMVLGFAYLVLFAFVTVGLVIAAVIAALASDGTAARRHVISRTSHSERTGKRETAE